MEKRKQRFEHAACNQSLSHYILWSRRIAKKAETIWMSSWCFLLGFLVAYHRWWFVGIFCFFCVVLWPWFVGVVRMSEVLDNEKKCTIEKPMRVSNGELSMRIVSSIRGLRFLVHGIHANDSKKGLIVSESSAMGGYKDSLSRPDSSYLWIAENHLNRQEVAEVILYLEHWLDQKRLPATAFESNNPLGLN